MGFASIIYTTFSNLSTAAWPFELTYGIVVPQRLTPMLPKSWRWFDVFRERIEACVALLERAEAARRARALFHVSPAVRRRQKRKRQMQALRAQGV